MKRNYNRSISQIAFKNVVSTLVGYNFLILAFGFLTRHANNIRNMRSLVDV